MQADTGVHAQCPARYAALRLRSPAIVSILALPYAAPTGPLRRPVTLRGCRTVERGGAPVASAASPSDIAAEAAITSCPASAAEHGVPANGISPGEALEKGDPGDCQHTREKLVTAPGANAASVHPSTYANTQGQEG